ncbi:MAG: 3-coathanger stack domain-containing protein [Thermoanaerobaculia bacterium]
MNPPILRRFALFLVVTWVSIAAPVGAEPETWALAGGSTTLYFNQHVLSDLGIEIVVTAERSAGHSEYHEFQVLPESPVLRVAIPGGSFERLVTGALRHGGGFDVRWDGGYIPLEGFELRPSPDLYTFELRATDGSVVFVLDYPHTRYIPESRRLVFINMDLRIAHELALRLGRPDLAGMAIGEGHVITEVVEGGTLPVGGVCNPDFSGEVDVELTAVDNLSEVNHDAERVAMAPSAKLANVGTADIEWFQSIAPDIYGGQSTLGQHPYLIMHLYRLADGVLQQIGRSDLKHAFFAQNGDCSCQSDQVLYDGCTDLYGTYTNTWQNRLAPRDELTSSTGDWTSLGSHFDGDPVDDYRDHTDSSDHPDEFEHRLTATTDDLLSPDASYFIEAWYLAKGDIDIFNSMGYRGIAPHQGNPWTFPFTEPGLNHGSVLDAWIDPAAIAPGSSSTGVDTGVGHLKLAVQTSPLDDGFYHYEVALMNLDFDRQIRSLSVTLPTGGVVRHPGFNDVDDNDGNDWQLSVDANTATWASDNGEPAVNALDWGTLYNFRFDTNVEPADSELALGVLEPGDPSTLQVAAKLPGTSALTLHRISLSTAGSGNVVSEPNGIACGLDCQEDFVEGIDVRLSANPAAGSHLVRWQEDGVTLTESSLYVIGVQTDRELTATFASCSSQRILTPATVGGEAVYETCQELVAGAGFHISGPDGDVTFRAGEAIVLGDGFVVESGAKFRAVVDPKLSASTEQ